MENFIQMVEKAVSGNPFVAVFLVYVAGILTSFTPCVYPMIPLTVGYIGAHSGKNKIQGFSLSLFYVFGVAITYTALGIFAALTGMLFGQISTHPVTYFFVANIVLLLGLNMLGVFEIRMPVFQKKTDMRGRNYFGAFIIGLFSGLIVSPCTAPVLFILLGFVATTKKALYGGFLMFLFAFGMGTLLILVGTFTGLVIALPKSGKWLEIIKKFFGWIMLLFAEYLFIKIGYLA